MTDLEKPLEQSILDVAADLSVENEGSCSCLRAIQRAPRILSFPRLPERSAMPSVHGSTHIRVGSKSDMDLWSTMMKLAIPIATAMAITVPLHAGAATVEYVANLTELSGSGVSGVARLTHDDVAMTLAVQISATGLEANQIHVQHIHGRFASDGTPIDSVTPTFAAGADTDGDGFIELAEGAPFYGPIILSLTDDTMPGLEGFPTAPDGMIDFSYIYDLSSTSALADGFTAADLFPLEFREIVIHGMSVPAGPGRGTDGEVDGTAGYKLVLPVAAGEISVVPLPAAGWMLLTAFAGLFGAGHMCRRASA